MRDDIAFLHTAEVHRAAFDALVQRLAPDLRVGHLVREDLLNEARSAGTDDTALIARVHAAMREAASGGAPVVVCTCSTLGGIAEATDSDGEFIAQRIDRAMADRAVRKGPRVLVVATVAGTLAPTTALIRSSAADAGVEVETHELLVDDAWPHFEAGDMARYIETVADAIRTNTDTADVVVLAQASMAPVANALHRLDTEVLSSPASGVERAIETARLH